LLAEDMCAGEAIAFHQEEFKKDWQIQIDHIVSLKDVWPSGGHRWSVKGRNWQRIANDPTNLLPVARSINAAKGNRHAAQWLPDNPKHNFRKRFVVLQVQVKARYRPLATESESAAMREALGRTEAGCLCEVAAPALH
jgi:hypothetical protein